MAYKSFKEYIEVNHKDLLQNGIEGFVARHHDGQGFHAFAFSILDQRIDNLQVMSLTCRSDAGPRIEIDAHVKADIVSKGLGSANYDADRKTRWFTVYLKAILKNGLHDVEILDVDEHYSGKFDPENTLDAYLLPYISTDQLEDLADDFTQFYCGEEAYEGVESPLTTMLHALELTWYLSDLPQGEMGRMYFRDKEETYEEWYRVPGRMLPKIEVVRKVVPRGTMLISKNHYFMNGYGSRADTIAHEIVHWDKHDHFFEVLALLNEDEKSLYCETIPMGSPEGLEGVAKARWWAEWQANALAPRYLMPRWIFNKLFAEQLAKYVNDDYLTRGQVMECAIGDTARYFQVSVYEVKLRALQLGYKQAEGTFLRVKGHEQPAFSFDPDVLGDYQTFILDGRNGNRLYKEDPRFAELIDSERYMYTGCVVCINNPLYVYKTEEPGYPQGFALTDYALEHIDECCLKFTRHYTQDNRYEEYYNECYLSSDVSSADFKETKTIEYEDNQNVLEQEKELGIIDEEGERISKILASLPNSFSLTFDAHMKRLKNEDGKKITNLEMSLRTGLSDVYIGRLRKGEDERPSPEVVFALCAALHLHPMFSDDMVQKAMQHYPYSRYGSFAYYLLHHHYKESLLLINEKLRKKDYPTWGKEENIAS